MDNGHKVKATATSNFLNGGQFFDKHYTDIGLIAAAPSY